MRPRRGASALSAPHASASGGGEQDGLFAAPSRIRTTAGFDLAPERPVAVVRLIGPLPHLDRPFEYAVTAQTAEAEPGMRVKVRFAGQEMDGIVLDRVEEPTTDRPLAPLKKVVSTDRVVTSQMLRTCADVAERCAGTVGDVLRLALPPRHARAERAEAKAREKRAEQPDGREESEDTEASTGETEQTALLQRYAGLAALVERAGEDGPVPRATAVLEPCDDADAIVAAAIGALAPGTGALVIAPDTRDVRRLGAALDARGIAHETLLSADGPEKRYRAFLRILHGESTVVIGTRSAAFAPVRDLGLIVVLDSDDDLLVEQRSPYPHALTVAQCRSSTEHAALLLLAHSPSANRTELVRRGYLVELPPAPRPLNEVRPRIRAMDEYLRSREGGSGRSRIPSEAMRLIRSGLKRGPVLVQVPRAGYVPVVACDFCGTRALCPHCSGPLSFSGPDGALRCGVCGRREDGYRCPECDRTGVRAVVIGASRTAEELRRAFPDVPLLVAGGAHGPVPDDAVGDGALVIATPGAEPVPEDGYAAGLLLDADAMLARAAYDADMEAVRRWDNAIALVRSAADGGEVLVVGTSTLPAIRELVAHRSEVLVDRVLADRRSLDLPPFTKVASATGDREAVRDLLATAELPDRTQVFGPVDDEQGDGSRAVLRIEVGRARELLDALRAAIAGRSARKAPGRLRVEVDPPDVF